MIPLHLVLPRARSRLSALNTRAGAQIAVLSRQISGETTSVSAQEPHVNSHVRSVITSVFSSKELADLKSKVHEQRDLFGRIYRHEHNDFSNAAALDEWMQTFYRRPRPDLLMAAIIHGMTVPGAFVGESAFPTAVFWSQILKKVCPTVEEAVAILGHVRLAAAAVADENPSFAGQISEQMDTLLRAFYLCGNPRIDVLLREVSESWQRDVTARWAAMSDQEKANHPENYEDVLALAASIFPLEGAPLHTGRSASSSDPSSWAVPSLNLSKFEGHVAAQPFSLYGRTRHLFMHTRAGHVLAKEDPHSFAVLVPHLATLVTKSLVDGYWAAFYATGHAAQAVSKVLDVGTLYASFVEQYGGEAVTRYDSDTTSGDGGDNGADSDGYADEFEDDPLSWMRFETSRYALHTLLQHAALHEVVGQTFLKQALELHDKVVLLDPISRSEEVTAFGERRLDIMRLLAPSIERLHETSALKHGIGSGFWPESYNNTPALGQAPTTPLIGSSSSAAAAGGEVSRLHGAAAVESVDLSGAIASLLKQGGYSSAGSTSESSTTTNALGDAATPARPASEGKVAQARKLLLQQKHSGGYSSYGGKRKY